MFTPGSSRFGPQWESGVHRPLAAALLFLGTLLAPVKSPAGSDSLPETVRQDPAAPQIGIASYYAHKYHGKPTASGELFDMHQLTAAHPTLPFGTLVRVTHLANRRSVVVRINDRGPFATERIIDVSLAAAGELRMLRSGLARVRVEVLPQRPRAGDSASGSPPPGDERPSPQDRR